MASLTLSTEATWAAKMRRWQTGRTRREAPCAARHAIGGGEWKDHSPGGGNELMKLLLICQMPSNASEWHGLASGKIWSASHKQKHLKRNAGCLQSHPKLGCLWGAHWGKYCSALEVVSHSLRNLYDGTCSTADRILLRTATLGRQACKAL